MKLIYSTLDRHVEALQPQQKDIALYGGLTYTDLDSASWRAGGKVLADGLV